MTLNKSIKTFPHAYHHVGKMSEKRLHGRIGVNMRIITVLVIELPKSRKTTTIK